MKLSRYIHLNPVRAGIVEKPEEYPYSSYKSIYIRRQREYGYPISHMEKDKAMRKKIAKIDMKMSHVKG